jgi:CelD/BcsL family acetyltransferase involved in cellulose biosynthesis
MKDPVKTALNLDNVNGVNRRRGTTILPNAPQALSSDRGTRSLPMQVEFVRSFTEMQALKDEWDNLFQNAIYHSLHGEPEFCLNWIEHFGKNVRYAPTEYSEHDQMALPIVIVGRNFGRLDLLMPLKINPLRFLRTRSHSINTLIHSLGLCQLTGLVNNQTDITNVLIRKGSEDFAVKAISYAISRLAWHSLYLGAVTSDSSLFGILEETLAVFSIPQSTKEESTSVLDFHGSFQAYLDGRDKLWKDVLQARRRLERDFGPLKLEWWKGQEAVEIGFPAFVEVDSQSWKATTPGGEALVHAPLPHNYYAGLVKRFASNNKAHVFALRLNGSLAAAELHFESNGILYAHKSSYKEAFAPKGKCRPGFVLTSLVIEKAWSTFLGMDFMSDASMWRQWNGENVSFKKRKFITSRVWRRGLESLLLHLHAR